MFTITQLHFVLRLHFQMKAVHSTVTRLHSQESVALHTCPTGKSLWQQIYYNTTGGTLSGESSPLSSHYTTLSGESSLLSSHYTTLSLESSPLSSNYTTLSGEVSPLNCHYTALSRESSSLSCHHPTRFFPRTRISSYLGTHYVI